MPQNWTPDAILELARTFQPMCVLAAGAELDVFALLQAPASAAHVAGKINSDLRAAAVLLDALAALGLLEKRPGPEPVYLNAPGVGETLTAQGSATVLAMVRHQANCLRRWSELAQVVQTGRPAPRRASIRGESADYAAFVEAMDNLSRPVAGRIIADLGALQFSNLLDVGGASGTWTIAFLRAFPGTRATIFDLPHVIPQARARLHETGLADRVTLVPGDFYTDPLPGGFDMAWVSAIVHQNSRRQNRDLFARIAQALAPGGRILIRDILMAESRTRPVPGALFAINMLVATQAGGTFTFDELSEDLAATGFGPATLLRRDEWMHSVISATRLEHAGPGVKS